MALPVREQVTYWGLAALGFLAALWLLGDVLLPFVVGGAVAYLLDPVADRLERLGLGRVLATVVITVFAICIFVLLALLIVPTLVEQASGLISTAPQIVQQVQTFLGERFPDVLDADSQLRQTLNGLASTLQERGAQVIQGVLASVSGLVNVVLLVVLVPVITFYLLLDWDQMVARVDELLPRDHAPVVRRLASEIDATLAAFLRGQGTVCLILGTFYAVGLMLAGLQFGLVVGLVAGLISFIPYVGTILGGATAIGLALFQFWGEWHLVGIVVAIFVAGQVMEGNFLTPKLVGSSVGLHPVWLIFALSAFGALFGFVGLLVAVPVAAMLGVLTRFGIAQYRHSLLYQGVDGRRSPPRPDQDPDGTPGA
jgi:predicted PurR-regulated permease PerM